MHIYAQNAYTYKIYTLLNLCLFVLLFFLLYIKRPLLYATTAKQGGHLYQINLRTISSLIYFLYVDVHFQVKRRN